MANRGREKREKGQNQGWDDYIIESVMARWLVITFTPGISLMKRVSHISFPYDA